MSNLEELVPPLELCLKIPFPKKNFRDSLFAWVPRFKGKGEWREIIRYELYLRPTNNDSQCIPAPTLQEIFVELAEGDEIVESFNPLLFWNDFLGGWILECRGKLKQKDGVIDRDELRCRDRKNPATAALCLWLDLNKTYNTDKSYKSDRADK